MKVFVNRFSGATFLTCRIMLSRKPNLSYCSLWCKVRHHFWPHVGECVIGGFEILSSWRSSKNARAEAVIPVTHAPTLIAWLSVVPIRHAMSPAIAKSNEVEPISTANRFGLMRIGFPRTISVGRENAASTLARAASHQTKSPWALSTTGRHRSSISPQSQGPLPGGEPKLPSILATIDWLFASCAQKAVTSGSNRDNRMPGHLEPLQCDYLCDLVLAEPKSAQNPHWDRSAGRQQPAGDRRHMRKRPSLAASTAWLGPASRPLCVACTWGIKLSPERLELPLITHATLDPVVRWREKGKGRSGSAPLVGRNSTLLQEKRDVTLTGSTANDFENEHPNNATGTQLQKSLRARCGSVGSWLLAIRGRAPTTTRGSFLRQAVQHRF